MADLMNVARKEFRGFFASPAAYLFMALFVAACLFVFSGAKPSLPAMWRTWNRCLTGCRCC